MINISKNSFLFSNLQRQNSFRFSLLKTLNIFTVQKRSQEKQLIAEGEYGSPSERHATNHTSKKFQLQTLHCSLVNILGITDRPRKPLVGGAAKPVIESQSLPLPSAQIFSNAHSWFRVSCLAHIMLVLYTILATVSVHHIGGKKALPTL